MEKSEIDTEHFNDGFIDAGKEVRNKAVVDMYKNREEAFKVAAGRGLSLEDLSKYRDGYNAGMTREIEHLGSRQASRDYANGGTSSKKLEECLEMKKWLKEPEHVKAFKNGYEKRAELDVSPIEASGASNIDPMKKQFMVLGANQAILDKIKGGASTELLERCIEARSDLKNPWQLKAFADGYNKQAHLEPVHLNIISIGKKQENVKTMPEPYEKGFKDSKAYATTHGVRKALEHMAGYLERIKVGFTVHRHQQYADGYKNGVLDQVHQLAGSLAVDAVKGKGDVKEVVGRHFNLAKKSLDKEMFAEFRKVYSGTLKNMSQPIEAGPKKQDLKVGEKLEIKQKQQEHSLTR